MSFCWHRNPYVVRRRVCHDYSWAYPQLPDLKNWGKKNCLVGDMLKCGLFTNLLIFIKYVLKTAYEPGMFPNTDKVPVLVKLIWIWLCIGSKTTVGSVPLPKLSWEGASLLEIWGFHSKCSCQAMGFKLRFTVGVGREGVIVEPGKLYVHQSLWTEWINSMPCKYIYTTF